MLFWYLLYYLNLLLKLLNYFGTLIFLLWICKIPIKQLLILEKMHIKKELIDFKNCDKNIVDDFSSFDEIFSYLENNKPPKDKVLCHGDLCLPNIICNGDKIAGFIDLGLTGIDNRYHDIAIIYRSIKYNFLGVFGKAYKEFDEDLLFKNLNLKKDEKQIKYYLLLDEVLG